ncbi:MAG: hypothetical protein KatS3mg035_0812 [Bacteroidia bacterium]|nr:MAG: hypothetical protein KatS3mg035_0812 [Bacteroidia bacterium]
MFSILSGPLSNSSVCQDQILVYEFNVSTTGFTVTPSASIVGIVKTGNYVYLHVDPTATSNFDVTFDDGVCSQTVTNISINPSLKLDLKVFLGSKKDGSGGMVVSPTDNIEVPTSRCL